MRQLLFLVLLTGSLTTAGCRDKPPHDPVKIELPEGIKDIDTGKNLIITLTADDKIYAGERELETTHLDSLLKIEMDKFRENELDTVTVVIHADSASSYGMVFNIMRAAKKQRAKVVARVD